MSNLPNDFEQHRLNALKSLHEKARLSLKHQNQHNFHNTNHLYSLNYQPPNNHVNTNYHNHGHYHGHNTNQFGSNSNYSQYNSTTPFNNTLVTTPQYPYQRTLPQVSSLASSQANFSTFSQSTTRPSSTPPSTVSAFDNIKNIPSSSLAPLADHSFYTPSLSLSENDLNPITESPKCLPVKKKDAKTAINDILALGYNYYDLVVLAGISPQFLDASFPEIKFEIQQKQNSLASAKDMPHVSSPSVSPTFLLRDSAKCPVTPSILTPGPQSSTLPSQNTSSLVPTTTSKHIDKKAKFGSNRWEKCFNITISDSDDSEEEFASNMKRKLPISRNTSQMNISEQIRLLKEKINKAEQVRIQTPPATDQPANVSPAPSKSLSPSTSSCSNSSDNLTKEIASLKQSPSLNAPTPPTNVHPSMPNSDQDSRIIKSKLAEAHNILDQYQKDRVSLLVEKTQCELQLKSMNMEKHQLELTELKNLLDQKLKEHIARRIEVATVKANLEAVDIRMKAINDSIKETRKSISSLDLKANTAPINVDSNIVSDADNDQITTKSNNENVETNTKPVNVGSGHSFSVSNTRMKSADFFATEILTNDHQAPLNSERFSSGDSPNSERRFNSDLVENEDLKPQNLQLRPTDEATDSSTNNIFEINSEAPSKNPNTLGPNYNEATIYTGAFRPYQSPLKVFRSFKFSPFYNKTVSGGYKSPTYSSFTPKETFCDMEFSGGCQNPNCKHVHFKDFILTDVKVLKELGNAIIGNTHKARKQYRKDILHLIEISEQTSNTSNDEEIEREGGSNNGKFETAADSFVSYRQSVAPDRILDWHKFEMIKSKKENDQIEID